MKKKISRLSSGYTLLELVIVIGLLALITTISIPHLAYQQRLDVAAEINALYLTILEAQCAAMLKHQTQRIVFSPEQNQYMWNGVTYPLKFSVLFGALPGIKGPPSAPSALVTSPITFKNNILELHSDGILDAGTVYMIDFSRKFMYAITIGVANISFIRKYHYVDGWKTLS